MNSNTLLRKLFVFAWFILSLFLPVLTQDMKNIEVTKLKDNFYRLTSTVPYHANFIAYVGDEGVLLVDAGQRETGGAIKAVLREIAPGKDSVKILINTHAHIDHTGGNLALAGGPVIIGPDILRKTLRKYSYVLYEFPDNALPSVTFTDSLTVYFGRERIRIIALPGSHDATDAIVHFTNAGIVYMGDISYGMTFPSLDGYTGNLLNYPGVIDRALALIPEDAIIVSGHGRESSVEELRVYRDMIANTLAKVKAEIAHGKNVETLQKEDFLKDYASFDGGIGADRFGWISAAAGAGPSKLRGSLAEELYRVLIVSNADSAIARYYQLKRDFPEEYPFNNNHLIRTGYWLAGKVRMAEAVKLFEVYAKEFPGDYHSYDYLGDICIKAGDTNSAIQYYEKALLLEPGDGEAKQKLKELKR